MKRWKVDINGRQDAILLLSSISLPGGVQVNIHTHLHIYIKKRNYHLLIYLLMDFIIIET